MKSVMQLITFLFYGLGKGIDTIKSIDPELAKSYLNALKNFTYIAIGVPAAFVGLGFVLYWVSLLGELSLFSMPLTWFGYLRPLWRISMLLGGASALGFVTILGVLAFPIGALIGAATAPPQSGAVAPRVPLENLPWYRWFSPIGILREFRDLGVGFMQTLRTAIERYISAVRLVLVVAGFGLFFFAALPRPDVTLFLFGLVGTWTIWLNRAYKTTWSLLAQAGAIVVTLIFALVLILSSLSSSFFSVFPKIEPEKLVLGGKEAKEFTNADLTSWWGELVVGIANHWVGVTIAIAVVLLLTYLMVKMFRGTSASAGTGNDHHTPPATPQHGGGTGSRWLGPAAVGAFLLLCVALIAKTLIGADAERSARIDRESQVARANHEARAAIQAVQSAAVAAQRPATPQPAPVASQPTPAQRIEQGLRNPDKHERSYTADWCERISKPREMSVKYLPSSLRPEVRINGTEILSMGSAGMASFPDYTEFFEVRRKDGLTTPATITLFVGEKAK